MKSHHKHYETGAGLIEYSPLILVCSCLLFSLFQVFVQGEHLYLLVIVGVISIIVIYIGGYLIYDNRRRKNKDKP